MIWFASLERGRKMTEKEKIIVSAYTGYLMTDFSKVHEYIEKKLDRPVWTHEMAFKSVQEEINEKCKDDFLDLCKKDDNSDSIGEWGHIRRGQDDYLKCSKCEMVVLDMTRYIPMNFCPICGAKMQ
jgi:hypothetical protein